MIIFRILRFPAEEVALSVRGRSNRLGQSTFCLRQRDVFQEVCAAFFRWRIRFVWECLNSVGERDQGYRKVEEEGIRRRS